MSYEISSLRIQTRELMEKMEILNKIIEGHAMERENLETELKIYKQKLSEAEKKIKVFLQISFNLLKMH
jgi:chromosome segregation ATPase